MSGMLSGRRTIPVLLPFFTALLILACAKREATPLPAAWSYTPTDGVPVFDGGRAFSLLEAQTAFGPRVPETSAHATCLSWLVGSLRESCDTVEALPFSMQGYDGITLHLTNVLGRINPTNPKRILLAAHWDSRPMADHAAKESDRTKPVPGANDGASGVAVLLHLAELLTTTRPAIGVDILLLDGEDYGRDGDESMFCLGAKHHAATRQTASAPLFGILLDLVGDRDAQFAMEEYSRQYAPDIVQLVWREASRLGLSRFRSTTGPGIYDDHVPLNTTGGIKMIDIIDAQLVGHNTTDERRKYWHTPDDVPANCSPETLEQVGRLLLHIIHGLSTPAV